MKLNRISKKEFISQLEKLPKKVREELLQSTDKHFLRVSRLELFLYEKPLFKVPLFIGIFFIISLVSTFFPGRFSLIISSVMSILITVYLAFFVFFLMRRSLKSLYSAKNIASIFMSYVLFIISITLIFSFAYSSIESMEKGYLTYGKCADDFSPDMIGSDPDMSEDYFYFSAVTIFTIGYGDICPMGWAKYVAIFNGFVGNFITVVLMAIVIFSFVQRGQP